MYVSWREVPNPVPGACFSIRGRDQQRITAAAVRADLPGTLCLPLVPIDEQAVAMEWGMRTDKEGRLILDEETGPIDYVQGQFLEPSDAPAQTRRLRAPKTLLAHFEGLQLFEPGAIACTEQLPAATYTLRINTVLMNGTKRADSVTFTVE
jgi:hypothetical protein